MIADKQKPKSSPRLRSVILLAALQILQGLGLLVYGIYRVQQSGLSRLPDVSQMDPFTPVLYDLVFSGAGLIVFSIPLILVSLALLRLRSWAWLVSMALQGLGLLGALIGYWLQRPNYLAMLVGVILIFYLNQQVIQATFRSRKGEL